MFRVLNLYYGTVHCLFIVVKFYIIEVRLYYYDEVSVSIVYVCISLKKVKQLLWLRVGTHYIILSVGFH